MFSTRKLVIGASLLTAATMLGCQAKVPEGVERLNNSPLIVDEAMQKREWDRSTSFYPNGDTVADGTAYMFETHETIPDPWRRVVEPGVATLNMALLPIGVFLESPFVPQTYQGAIIPPTHTAMPPLP
jgi:hypothetical protein